MTSFFFCHVKGRETVNCVFFFFLQQQVRKQTPKGLENRMCVGPFFFFFFFSSNKDTRQLKSTALGNKKNQINCVPSLFFYFILKVNFIIIQTWTDYTSCIIFSKIRDECLSFEQRISPFTQSWFFERETSSAATPLQNNKTNSNSFRFFFSRTR